MRKRYRVEKVRDEIPISTDVWSLIVQLLKPTDFKSLSLVNRSMYIKMRDQKVVKLFLWSIDAINKPWHIFIEKVVIRSMDMLRLLINIRLNLTYILFNNVENVDLSLIPNTVRTINYHSKNVTSEFKQNSIPTFITKFYIRTTQCSFNFLLVLPSHLNCLCIESLSFNERIDNLPQTLTKLYIRSNCFNRPIQKLPSSLTFIAITCNAFNQPLDNFPSSLIYIYIFSEAFAQHVPYFPNLEVFKCTSPHLISILKVPRGMRFLELGLNKITFE